MYLYREYHLTCNLCGSVYIGETFRSFRQCMHEHLTTDSSLFYKHFVKSHGMLPDLSFVTPFILKRGFANTIERKISEQDFISKYHPDINVHLA